VRPPVDRSAVSRENDPVESNPVARAIRDSYTPLVDRGCGGDSSQRWGFPADEPPSHGVTVRNRINGPVRYDPRINVTAVIATVPDPVHTHLAMQFDRALDVLLQAAAENGYVSSSYWLPWERHAGGMKIEDAAGGMEPGHDPEREAQPGLIILKHVPDIEACEDPSPANSFYQVIYLFLVAETPTKGVDGDQIQRAFKYEDQLRGILGSGFSYGRPGSAAIIGPVFTGSAASLRAAIDFELKSDDSRTFLVAGVTSSRLSMKQLSRTGQLATEKPGSQTPKIDYYSFTVDGTFTNDQFFLHLYQAGYDSARVAVLIEENTTLGSSREKDLGNMPTNFGGFDIWKKKILTIRFPREISLLRNAEVEGNPQSAGDASQGTVPSPYLHFTVKDQSAQDTAPQFSRENTPLSQESQLMAIAHQMDLKKIQFVMIAASNPLDAIFLASFLHRAYPDAQFVLGTDLLMTRGVDNSPFVGSIAFGPYHLMGIRGGKAAARVYTDSASMALYNAAVFIFSKTAPATRQLPQLFAPGACSPPAPPTLSAYLPLGTVQGQGKQPTEKVSQAPLWATTVGRDGYYPLGIINFSASGTREFMPRVNANLEVRDQDVSPKQDETYVTNFLASVNQSAHIYPALAWTVLCLLTIGMCIAHIVLISIAGYWSLLTRDLAIDENDEPFRRATYIHVGTAALVLIAWVLACPAVFGRISAEMPGKDVFLAGAVLAMAGVMALVTLVKTMYRRNWWQGARNERELDPLAGQRDPRWIRWGCFCQIVLTWILAAVWAAVWCWLCLDDYGGHAAFMSGLSFSFRCFHPLAGVSPIMPMLLLLLGWYLWGLFATWRLRFSEAGRPHLALRIESSTQNGDDGRYMVSDEDLRGSTCGPAVALFEQIETRFFVLCLSMRIFKRESMTRNMIVLSSLAILLLAIALCLPFRSVDHFLWYSYRNLSSPYEFLFSLLVFPLLLLCLMGWLRLIAIWSALQRGLLTRLENQPIRFAFSRLNGMGWMTMLRRVGWMDQWRDMDRCVESMCQILNFADSREAAQHEHRSAGATHKLGADAKRAKKSEEPKAEAETEVTTDFRFLLKELRAEVVDRLKELRTEIVDKHDALRRLRSGECKAEDKHISYMLMMEVDLLLAEFGRVLLKELLIPYWKHQRVGLVESENVDEVPIRARRTEAAGSHPHIPMELRAGPASNDPSCIVIAEEFVAIRYMSLIRAVLANLRYLMTFVPVAFVLMIVAWNSYPFQPREIVDWFFTGALLVFGIGVIRVFAQMHRDPILSRATDTKPNELGWDFYFRILAFGAVPVITWLAYEFPDIGSTIYRFVEPGTSVFK